MDKYFNALQRKLVDYRRVPEFDTTGEYKGIKAIVYDSAMIEGKKTKVFAYIGYPKKVLGNVPAVVLVHGGGGKAFPQWVKQWNDRGYAAIAMCTAGDFPTKVNAGAEGIKDSWHNGLYGVFAEEEYTSAPDNDEMKNSGEPLEKQWIYHAVSQVILAHNILRNEKNIDPNKIGIMGISWGGVITSIAIGYDTRFAFAIPVYGSGYLLESDSCVGRHFKSSNSILWLAENNFDKVLLPVLWQCWNKDIAFLVDANSKSYLETVKYNKDTRISIVHDMNHDHCCAWVRKEPFFFADSICKKEKKLPTFKKINNGYKVDNPDECAIREINLFYIKEPLTGLSNYNSKQEWIKKEIENKLVISESDIPVDAKAYYLEIVAKINGEDIIVTSQFVEKY